MKKIAIGVRTLKGGTGASAIVLNTAKHLISLRNKVDIYANKIDERLEAN